MRLLVVEDKEELARLLNLGLSKAGFGVDVCADALEAQTLLASIRYKAILLDLGLRNGEGPTLVRELRDDRRCAPIVALSASDGVEDRLAALRSGADDYLVKPFVFAELLARLESVLRQPGRLVSWGSRVANVAFDSLDRRALVDGKLHIMGPRDAQLLGLLMRRQGTVVSKRTIQEEAFGLFGAPMTDNAIETHVSRLRRQLAAWGAKVRVKTVRGEGYLLSELE